MAKRTGLLSDRKAKRKAAKATKIGGKAQKAVNAQMKASRDAASFNRVGQTGPSGSMVFDPATNSWKTTYGDVQQGQQDWLKQNQAGAMAGMGQPVDYSGITEIFGGDTQEQWRQKQQDAIYGRFQREFEPQFQQQSARFEQQMAERGIPIGSELYNREKSRMEQQQESSRQDALANASVLSDQYAQNMYAQSMQGRQQGIAEYNAQREQPFQEWSGVQASLQGSLPNFQTPTGSSMEAPDVAGTALGYDTLANQRWISQHPKSAGGSGGGGGYTPWTEQQWADYQRKADITAMYSNSGPYAQQEQQSNPYANAFAGLAQGVGQGIANIWK